MPELPEVESARAVIERKALWRPIVDVDDSDSYVSRPHPPGEIRHALLGGEFIGAMRRGKSIWCPTGASTDDVTLGIHLGMSGKIVIADANGAEVDGGDYWEGRRQPGDYRWARFTVTFADGGRLMLVDPRRPGRIRLNPPIEQLGPDAQVITPAEFRAVLSAGGSAPVKARIMDQHRIAGIGNLLADEILWRARIHPARAVGEPDPGRAGQAAARHPRRDQGRPPRRRGARPDDHPLPASGRPLPARSRADADRPGRRADQLVVLGRATVARRAIVSTPGADQPRHPHRRAGEPRVPRSVAQVPGSRGGHPAVP